MPTKNENREAAAAVGVVVVVSAAFTHFFCVSSVLDQTRAPSLAEGGTKQRRKKVWQASIDCPHFASLAFLLHSIFFLPPGHCCRSLTICIFLISKVAVSHPHLFSRCLLRFLKLTYFLQFKFPVCFFLFHVSKA